MNIAEIPCDVCGAYVSFDEDEWYREKYDNREDPENAEILCDECK